MDGEPIESVGVPESLSAETLQVDRAKQGDVAAFGELVTRYERRVYRMARQITQNDEDAEDVLQETFLKAFEHINSFQGQSKFYTWVTRIAVNESLMKLRKRKSDRTVSLDENIETDEEPIVREIAVWDDTPEQKYSQEEMREILNKAIDGLKPIFRTVFILRDVEELSTEETAEALGLSIAAVKSRLLRARLQLREKLTRVFKRKGIRSLATRNEMVTCKDFLRELSEYLDETTNPAARAELERHVSECPNCWVVCDTTRKTIQVYKGMDAQPISESVHNRLMEAIEKKAADTGHSGCCDGNHDV